MNTYMKYCPNVFLAKCEEEHNRGDLIQVETRYGKENDCIVHNRIGKTNDGFFCYSITREDGYDSRERARAKAERIGGYAANAERRSSEAFRKADMSEDATGIPFGQPILVGHHSEGRHRRTIERADNAMRKACEESDKAKSYESRVAYWESKADKIDLSMPESLEYYAFKLEEAEKEHKRLKDNPSERLHSYSLTYAKKTVNEIKKKTEIAKKLWGDVEPEKVGPKPETKEERKELEAT